jgi:iron complex outermembrane receptor protein
MKLKKLPQTLLAVGLLSGLAFSTYAQEVVKTAEQIAKEEAAKKEVKVQRVEVIGSNIKRTDTEGPSPVQTIKAEDILRSGASNMTELMQTIPSITSGGQDDFTSGNGFAAGTATISMRGLGSSSTLTLLNGRRMAATAAADPNAGQSTLFNINSIPMSAVERVDILNDAASAIYGSDAMAGVVNFVLKKNYNGVEMSARAAGADQGGFASQGVNLFAGFGDYEKDRYNVMMALDMSNRPSTDYTRLKGLNMAQIEKLQLAGKITDPDSSITFTPNYWQESRVNSGTPGAFITTAPLAPTKCPADQISTTWLASGAPTCVMDLSPYSNWTSQSKTANAFSRINFNLGENLTAYVELGLSRIQNNYGQGFATLSNGTSTWFDPSGVRRTFRHVMKANHPDNPLFQANANNQLRVLTSARLGDVPTSTDVVNTSNRILGALAGMHFGWDWEAGLLLNSSKRDTTVRGMIAEPTAQAALDQYRFGGTNSPELLKLISPDSMTNGKTEVNIVDMKGSTEWGQLSGGAIGIAAGTEFRQEKINIAADSNLAKGNFVGRGSTSANGSRTVGSVFAETRLPLLKSFELGAAFRYDKYSDYGSSATPKFSFKWTPHNMIALRGTVADGFRAPSLTQISESSVTSFQSIRTYRDTMRCPLLGGVNARIPGATGYDSTNECNSSSSSSSRTISSFIVANPDVQPETSKNKGLGIIFSPTASFSGTLDFYEIRRQNEVDRFSSDNILQRFFEFGESNYANVIFRGTDPETRLKTAAGVPIPGTEPIVGVKRQYLNLGETRTRGVDLELSHRTNFGEMGRLSTKFYMSFITDYSFQRDKGGPFVQYKDAGDTPKQKGRLSTNWSRGNWNVFGNMNYVSDYALPRTNSLTGERIECSPTITASADYVASVGGDCRVSSWTTFDFGATYTGINKLRISATVRNAFGRVAPFDPFYTYYNNILHNNTGRNFSINANYKF